MEELWPGWVEALDWGRSCDPWPDFIPGRNKSPTLLVGGGVAVKKEEKERNGFLFFPFLRIKTIKRIVSRPEHSLVFFFTLTLHVCN